MGNLTHPKRKINVGSSTINAHCGSLRAYMNNIASSSGFSLPFIYGILRKAYTSVWREHRISRIKFEYLCTLRIAESLSLPLFHSSFKPYYSAGNCNLKFLREWAKDEGYLLDGALTYKAEKVFRTFEDEYRRLVEALS